MAESLPIPRVTPRWVWAEKLNAYILVQVQRIVSLESNSLPPIVADLIARVAALETAQIVSPPFLTYVQETDPAGEPGNTVVAGNTWGIRSTGVINLRDNTNTFWIPFGAGAPDEPAEPPNVLLLDDEGGEDDGEELLFDTEGLTENGKLSELDEAVTLQPTDLLCVIQGDGTEGKRISLANFLSDLHIIFTDITTGDADETNHGYCPKLPDDPDVWLNGDPATPWLAMP